MTVTKPVPAAMAGEPGYDKFLSRFHREEAGGGTIWMMTWLLLFVMLGGIAIDTTNGHRMKSMLQASADSTAISAVIDLPDVAAAKAAAASYAATNLPTEVHGEALNSADITVGYWDHDTKKLSTSSTDPDATPDAVRVVMRRSSAAGNSVATSFLNVIGLSSWDVNNMATAQRFTPRCINDGIVAQGIVDMSSNNTFTGDICIHGQAGVDMQNSNRFEDGSLVSAPRRSLISSPSGDHSKNPGLEDHMAEQNLSPKMAQLARIESDILDMQDPSTDFLPDYIDASSKAITVKDRKLDFATMQQGRVYLISAPCKKGTISTKTTGGKNNTTTTVVTDDETLYASDGSTIRNIAVISECPISIGSGTKLENVLIASYGASTPADNMVHMASGVELGADDNCAAGGGVSIFTNGSVSSASQLSLYGAQIVAAGDVSIAAQAQGIEGVSIQAGGDIRITANNSFGLCAGTPDNIITAMYYRLVE